jgi:hypothetical protein
MMHVRLGTLEEEEAVVIYFLGATVKILVMNNLFIKLQCISNTNLYR